MCNDERGELLFRRAKPADVLACHHIELAGYGSLEAASAEKIAKRIGIYPAGFLLADWLTESADKVIGFINGTATDDVDLADEHLKNMQSHDPNGKNVVIMSVVVHPDFQGRGFAGQLLINYIEAMKEQNKDRLYLICKDGLIDFYKKYGFRYLRRSSSHYGGQVWHDMVFNI